MRTAGVTGLILFQLVGLGATLYNGVIKAQATGNAWIFWFALIWSLGYAACIGVLVGLLP